MSAALVQRHSRDHSVIVMVAAWLEHARGYQLLCGGSGMPPVNSGQGHLG